MSGYTFTSSLDLPDGRHVYASVEIPADHPAVGWDHFGECSEYTQIAVVQMLRNVQRGDDSRTRDQNEKAAEYRAELMEKLTGKAPF